MNKPTDLNIHVLHCICCSHVLLNNVLCFHDHNIERINLIWHSLEYPIVETNLQRKCCVQGAHGFSLLRRKCHSRELRNVASDSSNAPSAPTSTKSPPAITTAKGSTEMATKGLWTKLALSKGSSSSRSKAFLGLGRSRCRRCLGFNNTRLHKMEANFRQCHAGRFFPMHERRPCLQNKMEPDTYQLSVHLRLL